MKYRGVKITKVKYIAGIDIGKRENSLVKNIFRVGFSPIGVGYPMELVECYESIDRLINQVMVHCALTEKEAIKLLNTI